MKTIALLILGAFVGIVVSVIARFFLPPCPNYRE